MPSKIFRSLWILFSLHFLVGCPGPTLPGPFIIKQPFPTSVVPGESAEFSVTVEGSSPLTYQWFKNGIALSGSDGPGYKSPPLNTENTGDLYTVRATNDQGSVISLGAAVTVKTDTLLEFPLGVWMQSPSKLWEGRSRAQVYRDLGITVFMGLWGWPVEDYPGSNIDDLETLKKAGLKVYAGPSQDLFSFHNGNIHALMDQSLTWLKEHPGYESVFQGFIMGDEADMASGNYKSETETPKYLWSMPEFFKANSMYFRSTYAATSGLSYTELKFYGNFGKPFAKGLNYFKGSGVRRTVEEMAQDFRLYIDPLDIYSADYYGITDPYELKENHGIWTYGRSVATSAKWSVGTDGHPRELWGFLEASAPWRSANYQVEGNYLAKRQKPEYIGPIVWNMILHGATGIIYFCHDFLTPQSGVSDAGCLYEPGIPQAMAAVNSQIQSYASILLSRESAPAITVSAAGSIPISLIARSKEGTVTLFAQGDGNTNFPGGGKTTATFTLGGEGWTRVTVLGEDRELPVTQNQFTDKFEPYGLHIYRLEP